MKGLTLIAGLGVIAAAAAGATEYEWITKTVDDDGDGVGLFCSLALDPNGRPHIAYYDATDVPLHWYLKYAYYDGNKWRVMVADPEKYAGGDCDLAVDAGGHPHISYCQGFKDPDRRDLKYAYHDGSKWHITRVDESGSAGAHTSIALDAQGRPHIAYKDTPDSVPSKLKYAYFDGSRWRTMAVDEGHGVGYDTSIAVDSKGHIHISYREGSPGALDLKYAYYNGSTWQITRVDAEGNTGRNTSIAVDKADRPHISYIDDSNDALRYAYYGGSRWHRETVDDNGEIGHDTSIALDASDRPHISYHESITGGYYVRGNLKYAYHDGVRWRIFFVAKGGEKEYIGGYNSVALDRWGRPRIAYAYGYSPVQFVLEYSLKYAYATSLPAVELDYFAATARGDEALALRWSYRATAGEQVLGFNLYRCEAESSLTVPEDVASAQPGNGAERFWMKLNETPVTGRNPYLFLDGGVVPGVFYEYKLEAVLEEGPETLGTTAGNISPPRAFALSSAKPNPCSGEAVIAFELPAGTEVDLSVYDLSGRKVATLAAGWFAPGAHECACDVSPLAPGVYVYRLTASDWTGARKLVVVR
jgi:hypothetical protein